MATTFLTRNDSKHAPGLVEILRGAGQYIERELVDMADEHRRMKGGKRGPKGRGGFRGHGRGGGSAFAGWGR